MRIRRYEIDYIFEKINESQVYSRSHNRNCKFICIPRYNICINLRASSIHFFFTHVYKIRTYKTYLIWYLLIIVALFPFLHGILNLVKLKHLVKQTNNYKDFNWESIDLIYVEWHFFGIFSKKDQTVTHILAKPAYEQRFLNEINARNHNEAYKHLFPKLIKYSENPKYYTEELAVDSGNHLITNEQLTEAQELLININTETLKSVLLDTYYSQLIEKIGNLGNPKFSKAVHVLMKEIETNYLKRNEKIDLALVHGDFNKGQILVKDGKIKIIDWGDGGFLNRYFDYISIAIYKSPDHSFSPEYFHKEFIVLNEFFRKRYAKETNSHLYHLLTLLEIFAISKGEFEAEEGAYPRWLTSVENNQRKLVQG